MVTDENEIRVLEERLRRAMEQSDVAELDRLLADDLLFTDQSGRVNNKRHDLDMHRSGMLHLDEVTLLASEIRLLRDAAVVVLRTRIRGRAGDQSVDQEFAYTRIWRKDGDGAWRIAVVHGSPVLG